MPPNLNRALIPKIYDFSIPRSPRTPGKKGEAERFEKAKIRRAGFRRAAYVRIVKCAIRLVVLFCVGTAGFTFGFEW